MHLNIVRFPVLAILSIFTSCDSGYKHRIIEKGEPLPTGFYHITHTTTDFERELLRGEGGNYFIVPRPITLASDLQSAIVEKDEQHGSDIIVLQFNDRGTQAIAKATQQSGKMIGFIVDDSLLFAASIQGGRSAITTGQISMYGLSPEWIDKTMKSINVARK